MTEGADPTRFDDREFALILKKAAELQARDAGGAPRAGHTRLEIEEIAAEAGIDERYVRQAFALVTHAAPDRWRALLGPPAHAQAVRVLPGSLSPEGVNAVLDALQAEMGQPGSAREVLGGVEWTAKDSFGPVHAVVRPGDGGTQLRLGTDRRETAAVLHILLPIGGLIVGAVLDGTVSPLPGAATVALTTGGGLVAARLIWGRVMERWRGRVERMLDRAAGAAEKVGGGQPIP